jgi:branched-chain amino acid transport system substrate-binding protein
VLYQNDDYGADYLRGLKAGLTAQHQNQIVDAEPYDLSATTPPAVQVAKLKASGADTFVIFATPTPTIQAYVIATKLGWSPAHVITNSVSATDPFLTIATKSGSTITDGTISVNYQLDPSNPIYNKTPGMKLYRVIMKKYAPKSNANDPLNLYGVAKAWTTVQVLKAAGKNLTRAGLMKAARNMAYTSKLRTANPFLLPGVDIHTKGNYQYPISQVVLVQYKNHVFQPISKLINGRGA